MYEQYCGKSVVNLQNLLTVVGVLEKEAEKLSKYAANTMKDTTINATSQKDQNVINSELIEITTPVFPDAIEDGTIAIWHVEVGDKVERDQVICDIETDKVVLEVVAPKDSILYAVLKDEGETVLSKEKIAVLELKNNLLALQMITLLLQKILVISLNHNFQGN